MAITSVVSGGKNDRFAVGHDDMLGKTRTAISGASLTVLAQIRDTGFILEWLAGNADDFQQILIQVPHWRKMGTPLDSLHLHYLTSTAPNAGETVFLDYAYTWLRVGDTCPALADWTADTHIHTFAGTEGANYYGMMLIATNVPPPENEGYGGMILLKLTRNAFGAGSDTYTGDIGILDIDAHSQKDRLGSYNEASD